MGEMVEKARAAWREWMPGWLPVLLAACWIVVQYQKIEDRLDQVEKNYDTLEKQMVALQDYMRHDHSKSSFEQPQLGIQSHQKKSKHQDMAY